MCVLPVDVAKLPDLVEKLVGRDKPGPYNYNSVISTAGNRPTFVSGGWTNGNDILRFDDAVPHHMQGYSVTGSTSGMVFPFAN